MALSAASTGIVGAGIGGLHLGLYLRQHGVAATLYTERSADAVRAGFTAIAWSVSSAEVLKLIDVLPQELRNLWPDYMFTRLAS